MPIYDRFACERAVRNNIDVEDGKDLDQATMAVVALAKALDARLTTIETRLDKIERDALNSSDLRKAVRRG
jgi:hypothetical protein